VRRLRRTKDLSESEPAQLKTMLARMAEYGASSDQVPPTIFWPFAGEEKGVAP